MDREKLSTALHKVAARANGSKIGRFSHRPYRYLMAIFFSKILYRFTSRSWINSAETFFGRRMTIELPGAIDIYLLGCKTHPSELRLCKFLIRHLQPGSILADVGAHIGFFSLLGSELVGPAGKVWAFEPSSNSFKLLQRNTADCANVYIQNKAVNHEHNDKTQFHEFPARLSEFSSIFVSQLDNEQWIRQARTKTIETVSLDGFAEAQGLTPDMIKIDVEGAELLVLKGMQGLLQHHRPIVIMEYIRQADNDHQYAEAAALLRGRDYQPFRITSEGDPTPIGHIDDYLAAGGITSENIVFIKR